MLVYTAGVKHDASCSSRVPFPPAQAANGRFRNEHARHVRDTRCIFAFRILQAYAYNVIQVLTFGWNCAEAFALSIYYPAISISMAHYQMPAAAQTLEPICYFL